MTVFVVYKVNYNYRVNLTQLKLYTLKKTDLFISFY